MTTGRPFDIILYGATGFVGRQTVDYLARNAPKSMRWAVAGRSAERLAAVLADAGVPEVEAITAEGSDREALGELARRTRVVLSTAGPFSRYSDTLVEACVAEQTDYVDTTGETLWIRSLIDRWHETAAASGTRIIPACGFDCAPSDLGTLMTVLWIREHWGLATRQVRASYSIRGGGLNGGTLASVMDVADSGAAQPYGDVLLLNPANRQTDEERVRSAEWEQVTWDPTLERYLAPFFMGPVNTRVVRRSNALYAEQDAAYGADFTYRECFETRRRGVALGTLWGLRVSSLAVRLAPVRALARRLGPAPGEGPSEADMERGGFTSHYLATAADGRRVLGTMRSRGDAGNRSTTRLVCEGAFALVEDRERLPGYPELGGILTPATGLGRVLMERLVATEQVEWSVEPLTDSGSTTA